MSEADSSQAESGSGSGVVSYVRVTGGHRLWTCRYGPLLSPTLLVINGGPGYDHRLVQAFSRELPAAGISCVLYDQLGTGQSDRPTPYTDPALYSQATYAQHVEDIRRALRIDSWFVLGRSFGATVAMEYAVRFPARQHLRGLVVSNMAMSFPLLNAFKQELIRHWPAEAQATVEKYTALRQFSHPEYRATLDRHYRSVHFIRVPWPAFALSAVESGNEELMQGMCGEPDPLCASGVAGQWDRMADLPHVQTPTLVLGGRFDYVPVQHLEQVAATLPHAELYICENGSHMACFDDTRNYYDHLTAWVHRQCAQSASDS